MRAMLTLSVLEQANYLLLQNEGVQLILMSFPHVLGGNLLRPAMDSR